MEGNEDEVGYITLKAKIRKEGRMDLSGVKDIYIKRRLITRLHATGSSTYSDYVFYIRKHPEEMEVLKNTLTINVTRFFRNTETWDFLRDKILPDIIGEKEKSSQKHISIWSAGCSVGAEPYSISILVQEVLGEKLPFFTPKIIATDIDDDAMKTAREGLYKEEVFEETKSEYVKKYFSFNPSSKLYSVSPKVRSLVRIMKNDMIHDAPPFLGLDLILCRNVVIYFSQDTHEALFRKFFDALRPGGYLVLGGSETMHGEIASKFESVNFGAHAYRKPKDRLLPNPY